MNQFRGHTGPRPLTRALKYHNYFRQTKPSSKSKNTWILCKLSGLALKETKNDSKSNRLAAVGKLFHIFATRYMNPPIITPVIIYMIRCLMSYVSVSEKLFLRVGSAMFIARCYADRSPFRHSRSSVRLSVCLSVTLRYCDHTSWNTSKIISRLISLGSYCIIVTL